MNKYTSWAITFAAVVIIIGGMIWYAERPGKYDTFATCIKDSGAIFYGAFWCPHCQEQKALFGKSAKLLPYTECSLPSGQGQTKECDDLGIQSYPTWDFATNIMNGTTTRYKGTLELGELSQRTSCPLVVDNKK